MKTAPRIYLDACAVCRIFDDRSQLRVRQEAEAVEGLLKRFKERRAIWISSDALIDELLEDPDAERRAVSLSLLTLSSENAAIDVATGQRAMELETAGYGAYDALHLACAEKNGADVLLTNDDRFEKRVRRGIGKPRIPVQNPLDWWQTVSLAVSPEGS
jgi:predicted nucleic acid-binding protein